MGVALYSLLTQLHYTVQFECTPPYATSDRCVPFRYYLLANVTALARRALFDYNSFSSSEQRQQSRLPVDSPLRGYPGALRELRGRHGSGGNVADVVGSSNGSAVLGGDESNGTRRSGDNPEKHKKKRKGEKKQDMAQDGDNGNAALVSHGISHGDFPSGDSDRDSPDSRRERMDLVEISERLSRVMMTVRMVEEQSDLTAFLLPVRLSLPSSMASRRGFMNNGGSTVQGSVEGSAVDEDGDASSSSSDSSEEEGDVVAAGSKEDRQKGHASKGHSEVKGGGVAHKALAIERLRYHKKVCEKDMGTEYERGECVCVLLEGFE